VSGIGVELSIGGGVSGFTDKTMRQTVSSDVSGLWNFRASLGTRTPIGLDLSYVGTAANVDTFTGSRNGTLIGTTAEAAVRFNIAPHELVNPYIFAGAGWSHYDVRNMTFAQSDTGLKQSDDIAEFPMGAGVAYRNPTGLTVDVRGTFRAAMSSTLLIDPATANYADLHTWEASAALGYEF
jgi:hypothetical protein